MTETSLPLPLKAGSRAEQIFPTLTQAQLERITSHGRAREVRPGEVLFEAGEEIFPFLVVTAGRLQMGPPPPPPATRISRRTPGPVAAAGPHQFRRRSPAP